MSITATDDAELPVLSVSDFTSILKGVVEGSFPDLWIAGEISNLTRASSGHVYFTLKDADAQLKAVMWRTAAQRLRFDLHDGLQVLAAGAVEVYAARGQYQLMVRRLEPQGLGALELAFRQLQQKLEAEGLFDPARKRPLPAFPRKVALVTSPTGAAVRDLLQILTRRWPAVQVVILPVPVQGDGAAAQIAAALDQVGRIPEVDVVITGRGGGSLEDLWAFNEEIVARAIARCPIPVVSAVGHEIDVTIADLVADRRAQTPSEAAELVVPLASELREQLRQSRERLIAGLQRRATLARSQLEGVTNRRCWSRPFDLIQQRSMLLDECSQRLQHGIEQTLTQKQQQLREASTLLGALNPLAVLSRGFSLTKALPEGTLIRSADQLIVGQRVSTLLAAGSFTSIVERVVMDEDE